MDRFHITVAGKKGKQKVVNIFPINYMGMFQFDSRNLEMLSCN